MSYTDPNDPLRRDPLDREPIDRYDTTAIDQSSDSGVTWFIVGALVIAAGVLAYLYFGDDANTTAERAPTAIEAPADTGRAATPTPPTEMAPAPATPAPAAPVEPAPMTPAPATPAPAAP